jgi:hypothetical protein
VPSRVNFYPLPEATCSHCKCQQNDQSRFAVNLDSSPFLPVRIHPESSDETTDATQPPVIVGSHCFWSCWASCVWWAYQVCGGGSDTGRGRRCATIACSFMACSFSACSFIVLAAWMRHLQFSPLNSIVVTECLHFVHLNLAKPFIFVTV